MEDRDIGTDFSYGNAPMMENIAISNAPQIPDDLNESTRDEFLKDTAKWMKSAFAAFSDINTSITQGWLIDDARITSLSVGTLFADNAIIDDLQIGNDADGNITLSGSTDTIEVDDENGQLRVKMGKLGSGATEWGIQIYDASGNLEFSSSTTMFIDGIIIADGSISGADKISANSITADEIEASTITATELAANSVIASKINVSTLSAISANVGTLTSGIIQGATVRTGTGSNRVEFTSSGLRMYDGNTLTVDIGASGTFRIGPSSDDNIYWNGSSLTVTGEIIEVSNVPSGEWTDPDDDKTSGSIAVASGGTTVATLSNLSKNVNDKVLVWGKVERTAGDLKMRLRQSSTILDESRITADDGTITCIALYESGSGTTVSFNLFCYDDTGTVQNRVITATKMSR